MDTELWFPSRPQAKGGETRRVQRATGICKPCPVRMECLEFASVTGQRGIWGGLTEEQRRDSRLCRKLRAGVLAS